MAVLSVDLAYRRWSDLGIVMLDWAQSPPARQSSRFDLAPAPHTIACHIVPSAADGLEEGPVDAEILAGRLNHFCTVRDIRVILLDGPQAWKSPRNGLVHARVSERQLNTAAKTGLPGVVKPVTFRPFAEFCLDVWEALCRRGWRRLDTHDRSEVPQDRVLVESYPYAAWKSLGLKPLRAKRRTRLSDLAEAYNALRSVVPFTTDRPPNHDQLQAIVGGLAGLALEGPDASGVRIVGRPPRREEGHWREGYIVLPLPPHRTLGLRWLN